MKQRKDPCKVPLGDVVLKIDSQYFFHYYVVQFFKLNIPTCVSDSHQNHHRKNYQVSNEIHYRAQKGNRFEWKYLDRIQFYGT